MTTVRPRRPLLLAEGSTSTSADDLRFLLHTQSEGQPALLLAGMAQLAPAPFEARLLCVGGTLTRLALREDDPDYKTFGPGLRAAGGWSAGERRTFQVWYRVAPEQQPCCFTDDTNLSNAVSVRFGP